MNKNTKRSAVLMVIVDVALAILLSLYIHNTGTVPAADNADVYTDGTYTASETGFASDVAVTVTITGGKVTAVSIDASGETPEVGGKAAEQLTTALLASGSTAGVDAVSGSTMTSNAVLAAMDACLTQAAQ